MKKILGIGFITTLLFGWAITSNAQTAPPGMDCTAYPETRQFVDAQSWWWLQEGQTGNDFGHTHIGACIPERETLSADSSITVKVQLHDNPGKVTYVALVYKTTSMESSVSFNPGWTCATNQCEFYYTFPIVVSKFDKSGLQELRLRATTLEPDGKEERASLNWQTFIQNGKTKSDVTRQPYLRGKGWYTGQNYAEASFLTVPLPDAPLSGVWNPRVQVVNHEDSAPITGYRLALDTNVHAGIPGTTVLEGLGQLLPTTLSIDTTLLTNGPHKLFMRADSVKVGENSTNSGVLVVPFEVNNGVVVTPTPTVAPTATPTAEPTLTPTPTATPSPTPTPTPEPTCEIWVRKNGVEQWLTKPLEVCQ